MLLTVPLSATAQDLLKALVPDDAAKRRSKELVLSGIANTPFAGWSKAKRALDRTIDEARQVRGKRTCPPSLPPWNVHDLRRTVATGLQRLGVRLEVTEALLNHISGSRGGIAGVYQSHDWAPRSALRSIAGQRTF